MIPKEKSKMNLKILSMLRQKGAPDLTPFPGEQGFESEDSDVDQFGDILKAPTKISPAVKKKKKITPAEKRKQEEEGAVMEFVPADESIEIGGVN